PGLTRHWDVYETLYKTRSQFQEIEIVSTAQGMSLFCISERQSTELSQKVYHEGQFLPAVLLAERLTNVLIIGSSEGVVSQMARACGAHRIIHVDIDRQCVEACAHY